MGCINVSVERVGGITAEAERDGGINANTERLGGITTDVEREGGINAYAERLAGITVTVGLICSIAQGKILRVTPEEVQWVTIEDPAIYEILSNLDWTIS